MIHQFKKQPDREKEILKGKERLLKEIEYCKSDKFKRKMHNELLLIEEKEENSRRREEDQTKTQKTLKTLLRKRM